MGNSLLYILLLSVVFGRVRPAGRTLFFFCYISDVPNCVFSWEELCQFDTIPPYCRQNTLCLFQKQSFF